MQNKAWEGFRSGAWEEEIDVRDFIQKNYTLYEGDAAFLAGPTEKTKAVWGKCTALLAEELKKGGVLDVETHKISGICNFAPGYIDRENEVIVGLQTDAPLKRMVNLYGGMRMAEQSLEEYGYTLDPEIARHFAEYRKTHNQGVFDAYPKRVREARHAGLRHRGLAHGEERPLMHVLADAVAQPVDELLAQPGLLDDAPRRAVHFLARGNAGPERVHAGFLGRHHERVYF